MITAAEAKALYDDSDVEVATYLHHNVEPEIKAATISGQRRVFHYIGSRNMFTHPRPNPLESRVIEKLRELGFTVQWVDSEGESYVPRGLADDNGNGPSYVRYGLTITW